MQIPNAMPTLSKGAHSPGEGKACVMEYVSLLAGEEWSDHPTCTHPMLATTARAVNDYMDDEHRHLLIPLIGRLFGTNADDKVVMLGLTAFREASADWLAIEAHAWAVNASAYATCPIEWCPCHTWAPPPKPLAPEQVADAGVRLLTQMIDEYDRLTGRTEHREVTDAEYAELALAVG